MHMAAPTWHNKTACDRAQHALVGLGHAQKMCACQETISGRYFVIKRSHALRASLHASHDAVERAGALKTQGSV